MGQKYGGNHTQKLVIFYGDTGDNPMDDMGFPLSDPNDNSNGHRGSPAMIL